MSGTKRVIYAGVALLALVAAGAVAAPFLIPAERFLPAIEAQAAGALGAPVRIGSLRLRPGLGIRAAAGDIRVGGGAGVRALEVDRLDIGLRLLPLVRGEVKLSSISASGVRVRLRRGAHGKWGLEGDLGKALGAGAAGSTVSAPAAAFPVERVDLRDVRLTFTDPSGPAALRKGWTLGPARASVEPPAGGGPWKISLGTALGAEGKESLSLTGLLPPGGGAGTHVRLEVSGLGVEPAAQLMALAGQTMPSAVRSGSLGGSLEVRGLRVGETAAGRALVPGYDTTGSVELEDLQVELGEGKGARALRADASLKLEEGVARLAPLRLRLGQEEIEGSVAWRGGEAPELSGELRSKRLDLDQALALLAAPAAAPARGGAAVRAAARGAAPAAAPPGVGGRLQVSLESGRVMGMEFSKARADARLERGRVALRSLDAALYGGTVSGRGALVLGQDPLPFDLAVAVKGVDLEGALPALSPALKGALSGRFTGDLVLAGTGIAATELARALRGDFELDMREGRIASLSVLRQVAVLLEAAGGKGIGREFTPYQSITGDFKIEAGRARTRNLALRSEDLDLDGDGSFGLDGTLEFNLDARFAPGVTDAMVAKTSQLRVLVEKDGRLRLRLRMQGPLAAPKVELDQSYIKSRLRQRVQERTREKVRDKIQNLLR